MATQVGDVLVALVDVYGHYDRPQGSLAYTLVKIPAGSVLTVLSRNPAKKTVDVRVVGVEQVLTIDTMRGALETEWNRVTGEPHFRSATMIERVGAIPC